MACFSRVHDDAVTRTAAGRVREYGRPVAEFDQNRLELRPNRNVLRRSVCVCVWGTGGRARVCDRLIRDRGLCWVVIVRNTCYRANVTIPS